jgi:hypothetical protein
MSGKSSNQSALTKKKAESDHLKRDDYLREEMIRQEHIATAAYFRAERRGFSHGMAVEDWLEAEAEYDAKTRH